MRSEGNVYHPTPERDFQQMRSKAVELACDIRLHRSFVLPPNPSIHRNKAIRVSYSDVGYSDSSRVGAGSVNAGSTEIPVILWAGGMFGGRYQAFAIDDICKKHRVRFIAIDRPGIGGTNSVSLNQRIATWLDIVPALLDRIGVQHIHLAAHSAGTIFVLNTIFHQRYLLDPHRPSAFLFAPWVHPSNSGHIGLSAVSLLPGFAVGTWHHWASIVRSVTKVFSPSAYRNQASTFTEDSSVDDDMESTWGKASEAIMTEYIYAENIEGASQEALLCLKKGINSWGGWRDLDEAILKIADQERVQRRPVGREMHDRLRLQINFAENDEMMGKKGRKWLQSCFSPDRVAEKIKLGTDVVPGTEHNDVLALRTGAMEKMIESLG